MAPFRLDACDWSYLRATLAFLGDSKTGEVQESQDLFLSHCGFPQLEFNGAFLKHPVEGLEAVIERSERFFAARELPFAFQCRDDLLRDYEKGLVAAGYHEIGRMPVMVLDPIPAAPGPRPAGLTIETVESREDLEAFQRTAFAGFGLPEAAGALFLTPRFHAQPGVRLYLGRVDGEPVCTSALVVTAEIAGIYWVATRAGHRGRGYGEAVTWAAAQGGGALGCRFANLQASIMGEPVYQRMGFETPAHYVRLARSS